MVKLRQVGSIYSPDPRDWVEGAEYSYRAGEHQLSLFLRSPTAAEKEDISTGQAHLALRVHRQVIFLLFRFGRQPWNSAPYSWHLVPFRERELPPLAAGAADPSQSRLLHVVLVDSTIGTVIAMRDLQFPDEFSTALHEAIRKQAARRFLGNHDYERSVADIEDLRPSGGGLLGDAIARCASSVGDRVQPVD